MIRTEHTLTCNSVLNWVYIDTGMETVLMFPLCQKSIL